MDSYLVFSAQSTTTVTSGPDMDSQTETRLFIRRKNVFTVLYSPATVCKSTNIVQTCDAKINVLLITADKDLVQSLLSVTSVMENSCE